MAARSALRGNGCPFKTSSHLTRHSGNPTRPIMTHKLLRSLAAVAILAAAVAPCRATIYGTMSNFDVFNDMPQNAYGAELELEGVHAQNVINTYPSHFDHRTVTEYTNGLTFGTRVEFTGYNFNPAGYIAPTVGQSTNGHACVDVSGCEHFGFSMSSQ